ncbi:MAG: phosphoribosyltransferase family protein [Planctomycetota bacterium]
MAAKVGQAVGVGYRRWVIEPVDAFLPRRPPFDGAGDTGALTEAIVPEDGVYCPRCGRSTEAEALSARGCPTCHGHRLPWQRLVRLGAYGEPLAERLRELKFAQHWRLAEPLGRALGERVGAVWAGGAPTVVTWVPLHWTRRWRRGYDQSRLLADAVSRRIGATAIPTVRRVRRTRPQSLLTEAERRRNVTSTAFATRTLDLKDHRVVLVDDVLTTGSTAAACCRLLNKMGAAEVTLAIVAVTQRNRAPLS